MENYKGISTKWETSPKEQSFIDYCLEHNYKITSCKQYISKTKWTLQVNNSIEFLWETNNDTIPFNPQMLEKSIELQIKLEELQEQLNNKNKGE